MHFYTLFAAKGAIPCCLVAIAPLHFTLSSLAFSWVARRRVQ